MQFSFFRCSNKYILWWQFAFVKVLGLLVEVKIEGFRKHLTSVFSVMRNVLQSANDAVKNKQMNISDEERIPFWKESYYSLVMLEKILHQFPKLCLGRNLEVHIYYLFCLDVCILCMYSLYTLYIRITERLNVDVHGCSMGFSTNSFEMKQNILQWDVYDELKHQNSKMIYKCLN